MNRPATPPTLKELKQRAQLLDPVVRLGRDGVSPGFLAALGEALDHAGLVKVRFESFKDERKSLSRRLSEETGSRLIQQVGHTAVYYRTPRTADGG